MDVLITSYHYSTNSRRELMGRKEGEAGGLSLQSYYFHTPFSSDYRLPAVIPLAGNYVYYFFKNAP